MVKNCEVTEINSAKVIVATVKIEFRERIFVENTLNELRKYLKECSYDSTREFFRDLIKIFE